MLRGKISICPMIVGQGVQDLGQSEYFRLQECLVPVLLAPSSLFSLLLGLLFLEGTRCHGAPQQHPRPIFLVENLGLSLR